MAMSPSTDLAALPGVRLPKILRPVDRLRESQCLPLAWVHRWLRPDYLALCYHSISDGIDPLTHFGYDTKSTAELDQDLRTLARTFGVSDASAFAWEAAPVPSSPGQALITFDDGHRQWHDAALPVLARLQVRPIMFVVSGTLDNRYLLPAHCASLAIHHLVLDESSHESRLASARRVLGLPAQASLFDVCDGLRAAGNHERRETLQALMAEWGIDIAAFMAATRPYLDESQLRALVAAGCVLGAHSVDHRSLHSVPFTEVSRQILESCARIRDISGQKVVPFAFPYSRRVAAEPLARLRQREPWLGAYFGTGGLQPAPSGFYERIVADWRMSAGASQREDAILLLVRRAYLSRIGGLLRRGPSGRVTQA